MIVHQCRVTRWCTVVALACLYYGCADGERAGAPLHFTDVTAESGLDFTLTAGGSPPRQILEVKGGGLALIDFDGDGDLDVFLPNGATLESPGQGPGCRLFRNEGGLRFVDATAAAGLTLSRWGIGVAVGDYDADGHDDLYVTCYGKNALLRNTGDGRFEDVTDHAGVGDDRWGTGCAFGDLDGDGDLDLYVTNYVEFDPLDPPPPGRFKQVPVFGGPAGMQAQADVIYENRGDGTYRDVTEAWGFRSMSPAYGLGVVILDIDGDGRQEVFVGNDSMANFLFDDASFDDASFDGEPVDGKPLDGKLADDKTVVEVARGFADRALVSGVAFNAEGSPQATMGIAVADVDGNGLPDLFTTNFSDDTNTLHLNLDGRFFDDRTAQFGLAGVSRPFLGWAAAFADFDHDGDEDLLAVNGHVYAHATRATMNAVARQPPLLFARVGARFERVLADGADGADGVDGADGAGAWLGESHVDRSAVLGDLDGDGDVDVIVAERNGPLRVLRNDRDGGGCLIVHLLDDRPGAGNRRGLGSRVELHVSGRRQVRWVHSGAGYLSSSAAGAHFGWSGQDKPERLEVTWPDGVVQRVTAIAAGPHMVVHRAPD